MLCFGVCLDRVYTGVYPYGEYSLAEWIFGVVLAVIHFVQNLKFPVPDSRTRRASVFYYRQMLCFGACPVQEYTCAYPSGVYLPTKWMFGVILAVIHCSLITGLSLGWHTTCVRVHGKQQRF